MNIYTHVYIYIYSAGTPLTTLATYSADTPLSASANERGKQKGDFKMLFFVKREATTQTWKNKHEAGHRKKQQKTKKTHK